MNQFVKRYFLELPTAQSMMSLGPINDVTGTWPNQWCHMTAQGQASPVDKGWYQLTAVLNFGVLKRIQTSLSLFNFILGFWRR